MLPFLNTTGDQELEYLAEGITDNIINNLSRVSKLRVMSRSTVFRYKSNEVDPQKIGKELGANAVLIGKVKTRPTGVVIDVELVDVAAGWQLWGETFDSNWSRYTKKGIEKAIRHFRDAIELDSNYALAYAGIVDCYLRLATNYLPPEDDVSSSDNKLSDGLRNESEQRITLRFEWDWKGIEGELRRADELRTSYLSPHQWHFAYLASKQLYRELFGGKPPNQAFTGAIDTNSKLASQIPSVQLTPNGRSTDLVFGCA